jgi:hypothetical protein
VEELLAKIAKEKDCEVASVSLLIDGEKMAANQAFEVRQTKVGTQS